MAYTTINKSSLHFNTKLFTGNGGTNAQTGVGFQPDLLWFKNRSAGINHMWFDSVRGINKYFYGNLTEAQGTSSSILTARGSDGFTVGANGNVNGNGNGIASWNWKAGSSFSNSAGANGASIASTGSVNTAAGFSIISYTGNGASSATLAHGLGAVPKMMIVKRRDASASWFVYHHSIGANNQLKLDNNEASSANQGAWNNTAPTSSLFTIGTADSVNANNGTYIAYIFAEKQGYSKMGGFTGNGNADGIFCYLGFKPAFVMVKRTNNANFWLMRDNKRSPQNVTDETLAADSASTEAGWGSSYLIDMLSNGFKMRDTTSPVNTSTATYIFQAFAEAPLVGTNNVPATAR